MKLYKIQKVKGTNDHRVVVISDNKKIDQAIGLKSYDEAIHVLQNLVRSGGEYDWEDVVEVESFESADRQQAMLEIMLTTKGHDEPKIGSDYMEEGTVASEDDVLLDDKLDK